MFLWRGGRTAWNPDVKAIFRNKASFSRRWGEGWEEAASYSTDGMTIVSFVASNRWQATIALPLIISSEGQCEKERQVLKRAFITSTGLSAASAHSLGIRGRECVSDLAIHHNPRSIFHVEMRTSEKSLVTMATLTPSPTSLTQVWPVLWSQGLQRIRNHLLLARLCSLVGRATTVNSRENESKCGGEMLSGQHLPFANWFY